MKNQRVCVCNKCEKEFEYSFKHEVVGKDKKGGDVVQTFIICPHCGARFNSAITDSVYDELCAHYRTLGRAVYKATKNGASAAVIKANVNKMNNFEENEMKPYYKELKAKYSGDNNAD